MIFSVLIVAKIFYSHGKNSSLFRLQPLKAKLRNLEWINGKINEKLNGLYLRFAHLDFRPFF